jgi:lysophospholipase L1-like esterase
MFEIIIRCILSILTLLGFSKSSCKDCTYTSIGDSVLAADPNWLTKIVEISTDKNITIKNHSIRGYSIMENFDSETVEASEDDADIIFLALGTNDDNSGDMKALQEKVESNIIALKSSNPRAKIYYLNVLPRFDGVDKTKIRNAIIAACANQSIVCWDTYTSPWITDSDTRDHVHPNAKGIAKIAAKVYLKIQLINH